MSTNQNPFVSIETIHHAEVAWWWTNEKLHDTDYNIRVADSMDKKVKELEAKYDIRNDTGYCCQWEGRMLYGSDLQQVTKAANELAVHLSKFKGVVPL